MSPFSGRPEVREVPDFTGLDYDEAKRLERGLGLHLADPDPDAPPISNHWWDHRELVVLTQNPSPGALIERRTSVTVTLGAPGAPDGARTRTVDPPRSTSADRPQDPGTTDPT